MIFAVLPNSASNIEGGGFTGVLHADTIHIASCICIVYIVCGFT